MYFGKGEKENAVGLRVKHLCFSLSPKLLEVSFGPATATESRKNKIQLNKLRDLIGFIQWFMSQAASHLASWKELRTAVQNKRFFMGKKGWEREVSSKEWIVLGKVTSSEWQKYSTEWITSPVQTE